MVRTKAYFDFSNVLYKAFQFHFLTMATLQPFHFKFNNIILVLCTASNLVEAYINALLLHFLLVPITLDAQTDFIPLSSEQLTYIYKYIYTHANDDTLHIET